MAASAVPSLRLNSGFDVPQFGFGCFAWSEMVAGDFDTSKFAAEFKTAVAAAVDAGYRHFDTAMFYKNEKEVGEALNEAIAAGKVKREDLFVTSKIATPCLKYENAVAAIDWISRQLNMGYVDLILIHYPVAAEPKKPEDLVSMTFQDVFAMNDADTDYLETWKAMEEAVKAGKVRSIGLSNFNSEQIQRVIDNSTMKPAMLQVECHPTFQQTKLKAFLKDRNILMTSYSPLQNPSINKHKMGNLLEQPCIVDIAKAHGKTPAQVVLRWNVQCGNIVIPKSSKPHRMKQNISVFDFKLTDSDMAQIAKLDKGKEGRHMAGFKDHPNHKNYPFKLDF